MSFSAKGRLHARRISRGHIARSACPRPDDDDDDDEGEERATEDEYDDSEDEGAMH